MKRFSPIVPVAALVLLGLAVYYPVIDFDFVSYDDPSYVSRNIHSLRGLNAEDFSWALTTRQMGQWHPIAWWSIQLDSQLFGPTAWGFHLSNLIYHLVGTCLLYASLRMLKLGTGFAFLVSALFCIHPLHAESVAWISERKGILSTVFWFTGMLAYAWYARRPSWYRMSLVVLAMSLGLMTKQMLVTFPFAMLLLDMWPLERLRLLGGSPIPNVGMKVVTIRQAIVEKLPLFALSILFCGIAYVTQARDGAANSLEEVTFLTRLLNVPATYVFTLLHTCWPLDLCAIYLPPHNLAAWSAIGSAVLLLGTYLAWKCRTSMPAVLIGWLWFLGCLLPLSGIVPLGSQWTADRYTDIPLVGIYLAVVSASIVVAQRYAISPGYLRGLAVIVGILLSALCIRQLDTWRDAKTLMSQAVEVDPENHIALSNLASDHIEQQQFVEALQLLERAVQFGPNNMKARINMGLALFKLGQTDRAIEHFQIALNLDPTLADAHLNLGNCFRATDRAKAMEYYREAVRLNPEHAEAHNNLGAMLATNSPMEAKQHYQRSLEIWPDNADAHCNLANLFARTGQWENAISEYNQALAIDANHQIAQRNLRIVLATQHNSARPAEGGR